MRATCQPQSRRAGHGVNREAPSRGPVLQPHGPTRPNDRREEDEPRRRSASRLVAADRVCAGRDLLERRMARVVAVICITVPQGQTCDDVPYYRTAGEMTWIQNALTS